MFLKNLFKPSPGTIATERWINFNPYKGPQFCSNCGKKYTYEVGGVFFDEQTGEVDPSCLRWSYWCKRCRGYKEWKP